MTRQIFSDGISRIRIVNGTVRIEFVSSVEDGAGKTRLEPELRLVMPIEGFLAACRTMGQAAQAVSRPAPQPSPPDEEAAT